MIRQAETKLRFQKLKVATTNVIPKPFEGQFQSRSRFLDISFCLTFDLI